MLASFWEFKEYRKHTVDFHLGIFRTCFRCCMVWKTSGNALMQENRKRVDTERKQCVPG
jgi:hypothetical protein